MNGCSGGLAGTMDQTSRIPVFLVLGMLGLATCLHLPNFVRQGGKGGDFLSGVLKKYDPDLAWRKALTVDIEGVHFHLVKELQQHIYLSLLINGVSKKWPI
ncbi:hypothetical protein [Halobacillus hunanensis]|uniref:hypothetical protein n=1 Tax=Halobacillus hunanensis TaxID=578214 RepID=UPI00159278A6|nr:hypothetical protein [Halobacillus hunanensis]